MGEFRLHHAYAWNHGAMAAEPRLGGKAARVRLQCLCMKRRRNLCLAKYLVVAMDAERRSALRIIDSVFQKKESSWKFFEMRLFLIESEEVAEGCRDDLVVR